MGKDSHYTIDLSRIYKEDEELVGKKAHEIGMLWRLGIPLPKGFVITTEFFNEYLCLSGIDKEIKKVQALDHPAISDTVKKLFHPIQKEIMRKPMPQSLSAELHEFYRKLSGVFKDQPLNVFSSSSNNKSIVFSNVKGDANLILKIKTIWSMFLTDPVAIVVQENIKFDTKGKVFTDNPSLDKKLTKQQMNKLIDYCNTIRKHFYFPYEIEYAVSNDIIFITKVNPFTGIVEDPIKPEVQKKSKQKVLIKGIPINPGIVTGRVKILHNKYGVIDIKKEDIVVLSRLDPSIFERMKNAKAVIIDSISPNSLNKTLYRKNFQIPTIEGTGNATKMFRNGNVVTVNGTSGEIYSGGLVY
ncbi:MAG: PEP/pyruvate-binding domain-containing protein [Candidatus Levybacteria bacterium]|nr:PEP/pyruvate-binding domain-containing protein [Candidatus Levybacteria bacterium]